MFACMLIKPGRLQSWAASRLPDLGASLCQAYAARTDPCCTRRRPTARARSDQAAPARAAQHAAHGPAQQGPHGGGHAAAAQGARAAGEGRQLRGQRAATPCSKRESTAAHLPRIPHAQPPRRRTPPNAHAHTRTGLGAVCVQAQPAPVRGEHPADPRAGGLVPARERRRAQAAAGGHRPGHRRLRHVPGGGGGGVGVDGTAGPAPRRSWPTATPTWSWSTRPSTSATATWRSACRPSASLRAWATCSSCATWAGPGSSRCA